MADDEIEVCRSYAVHDEAVKHARESMPGEKTVNELSLFFKVFGDPTRIRILNALFHGELCVCDLAAVLGMNQPAVSHQLALLKQAGLVRYRKDGKTVYYALDDVHVMSIYDQGLTHIRERREGIE